MKVRHFVVAGLAVLAGLSVTAYAHLAQDSDYTYFDEYGGYVGEKYVSCEGHVTIWGQVTSNYTVEHIGCGDMPGTGTPVDGTGGNSGPTQSCGGPGQQSC